jgi:putative hemolysin
MDIKYNVHNAELLDTLPEGAFITISNHPFGHIDGIMLIDIFAARRSDFAVMVNGVLTKIGAMEDNFISVQPDSKNRGANVANVNGVRTSLERLKSGHPMGFFPAGAISFYNKEKKRVMDLEWTLSVIRLIRKGNVPVYPVFFDGLNSSFFYWLGRISWKIRT